MKQPSRTVRKSERWSEAWEGWWVEVCRRGHARPGIAKGSPVRLSRHSWTAALAACLKPKSPCNEPPAQRQMADSLPRCPGAFLIVRPRRAPEPAPNDGRKHRLSAPRQRQEQRRASGWRERIEDRPPKAGGVPSRPCHRTRCRGSPHRGFHARGRPPAPDGNAQSSFRVILPRDCKHNPAASQTPAHTPRPERPAWGGCVCGERSWTVLR